MNAAKPILQRTVPPALLPPFLLDEKVYDSLAEVPLLHEDVLSPSSTWTFARKSKAGGKMPQAIAHRGYKAEYPENTMGAFHGAVKVGAHALETDLHISKDNVVVISHDATLKRCYGKDEKISDCNWDYLGQQRTLRAPHEPMPRLQDLLEYLSTPGMEHVWLLLDIKMTNDAETIMRLIAHTISLVTPSPSKPWYQRLVLGIWAAKFLPHCARYLPHYPISHIGFSIPYARQFLNLPNISFNTLQKALMGPGGTSFIRDVKAKGRPLYVWTVNEEYFMRWSIDREVDGVITDDPKKFLEVCDRWEKGDRKVGRMTKEQFFSVLWFDFMILVFGWIFRWRAGGVAGGQLKSARTQVIEL